MTPPPSISGSHLRTYETIFQHPISHNLGWHDVLALFRQLGQVEEHANGNFKVSRHGQILVLPASLQKDVSSEDDVMRLRHFIQHTEAPAPMAQGGSSPWLLVINHHEARLFRSLASGTESVVIQPPPADPDGHGYSGLVRGQEKPAEHSFFAPIAVALAGAGQILLFGSGTGGANESDRFVAWAKSHQPELARRITATLIIDEHHFTGTELLAKAREFQAQPRAVARA